MNEFLNSPKKLNYAIEGEPEEFYGLPRIKLPKKLFKAGWLKELIKKSKDAKKLSKAADKASQTSKNLLKQTTGGKKGVFKIGKDLGTKANKGYKSNKKLQELKANEKDEKLQKKLDQEDANQDLLDKGSEDAIDDEKDADSGKLDDFEFIQSESYIRAEREGGEEEFEEEYEDGDNSFDNSTSTEENQFEVSKKTPAEIKVEVPKITVIENPKSTLWIYVTIAIILVVIVGGVWYLHKKGYIKFGKNV